MIAHRIRLVLLILIWGASWPAIKIGIATTPPLWYAYWRYALAALCMFAFVGARGELTRPPRSDWPLVIASGALQMATYSALTGVALTVLPPGRASVLAYSTPLWVVPLAAWRLQEWVSRWSLLGVTLGMSGAFVIASPSFHTVDVHQIRAYGMLVGAAGAWAIAIVVVRSHRFTATPLALAPWQMLIAAFLLFPTAILIEGPPARIDSHGAATLVYVGPVATAFAYWSMVETGRRFRASAVSMALLAVPVVGMSISARLVGERIDPPLVAGALLIGIGICLATVPRTSDKTDGKSNGLFHRVTGARRAD